MSELYQFYRIETYARQVSKKAGPKKRWTVNDIVAEAYRKLGHCGHVKQPLPPLSLICDAAGFMQKFETAISNAAGTHLRSDTPVIVASVTSWPVPLERLIHSAEQKRQFFSWILANLTYFRSWCQMKGGVYASSVVHFDEGYPHMHHIILPTGHDMRAKCLLPGYSGEMEIRKKLENGQLNEPLRKAIRRAHAEGFRSELQSYHAVCGEPFGHLIRSGLPRRRLSRVDLRKTRALALARSKAEAASELLALMLNLRNEVDAITDDENATDEPDDDTGPQL